METTTHPPRRSMAGWSTRDILVTSVLGLACSVLIVPLVYLYAFLLGLGPLVLWATTGAFFFPAFFIAYVIRRPGAALLGMLVVGLVQLPFTPAGAAFLASAVLRGLLAEPLVALITRYRQFTLWHMLIFGALTGLLFFLIFGILLGTVNLPPSLQLVAAVIASVSCLVSALLAKGLAEGISRAGVLNDSGLGQPKREEI